MQIVEEFPVKVDDRAESMFADRDNGLTLQEIGDKWGLTRERVRQVLAGSGYGRDRFVPRSRLGLLDDARGVAVWLQDEGPVTRQQVLDHFGCTERYWHRLVGTGLVPTNMVLLAQPERSGVSQEDSLEAMRVAWAAALDADSTVECLTRELYREHRKESDPSPELIVARWGWSAMCIAAGVPLFPPRREYTAKWSDGDILGWITRFVELCRDEGRLVSFNGYQVWARSVDGAPSGPTVRNRLRKAGFVSWADMVVAAVEAPRPPSPSV